MARPRLLSVHRAANADFATPNREGIAALDSQSRVCFLKHFSREPQQTAQMFGPKGWCNEAAHLGGNLADPGEQPRSSALRRR